jgi:hypothetical protein
MNVPEERKIKDWKHPVGLIKVEGMNVKALEFYGAEIIDHIAYVDG